MTKRAENVPPRKLHACALPRRRETAALRLADWTERLLNLDEEIQQITDAAYETVRSSKRSTGATREEANQIMMEASQRSAQRAGS